MRRAIVAGASLLAVGVVLQDVTTSMEYHGHALPPGAPRKKGMLTRYQSDCGRVERTRERERERGRWCREAKKEKFAEL